MPSSLWRSERKQRPVPKGTAIQKRDLPMPRTGRGLEPEIGEVVGLEGLSCSGGGISEDTGTWIDGYT